MYMKLKDGKSKVLALSYDDGVVQDMQLMKIINQYGLKCTFHICTGLYFPEGKERKTLEGQMTLSEAQALYRNSGHEVACHTFRHARLDLISEEEAEREVMTDRINIEQQYGQIARGMAYPSGGYHEKAMEVLKRCGICYSRISDSSFRFDFPKNWLALAPTVRHGLTERLWELTERFVQEAPNSDRENWMFLLRGHSYEFDKDDNWDVIENFAKKVGNRDDIWYAPIIDIYDYVKAYESLYISADGSAVYNPTCTDVWVGHQGRVHCVKSGQTVWL